MNNLLIGLLLIISLILCILPHEKHCEILKTFTDTKCPPHICLVSFGIVLFIITVILAQTEYIKSILNIIKDTTQVAGSMAQRLGKIGKKALSKLPNTDEVVDRVENFVDTIDRL